MAGRQTFAAGADRSGSVRPGLVAGRASATTAPGAKWALRWVRVAGRSWRGTLPDQGCLGRGVPGRSGSSGGATLPALRWRSGGVARCWDTLAYNSVARLFGVPAWDANSVSADWRHHCRTARTMPVTTRAREANCGNSSGSPSVMAEATTPMIGVSSVPIAAVPASSRRNAANHVR